MYLSESGEIGLSFAESGLNDGIYKVNANLTAYNDASQTSMADASINHEAYLTKTDNDISIYLDFNPIYVIDANTPSYCGGLWSEKGISADGEYYTKSEIVLSYYTNSDGTIRDNDIYNGVTQIPSVKKIGLNLERDCYNNFGGYTLVVSSPAMAALNHIAFADMIMDTLTCNLMISNPTYLGTMDLASSYLPTYDITALQREYEYANILADDNIYTDESWADVQALLDTETTTEDKKCVTGYSDTAELTARIAEYQSATAALVVDESKKTTAKVTGYSLTAKEDFGLHLFVSLSSDARNDANAAVKFNIGGTEKTIAVSDATFVEGKGYEFVLDVPAKKMYDEITAEIVLSDGAEIIGDPNLGTYSVAGYLNDYLADSTKTELDALAQATLTYGAYADKFFNGSTDAALADVSTVTIDDVAQYKHNINVAEEGIEFIGAALTLESKTSVKLYFKVDEDNLYDITDFAFTVNGNKAEPERNGDYYYITVPKLPAGELAKAQTFTVNDAEFSYSPFSYVYAALADSDAEKEADLINLVKALYLYGVEADKVA